MKSLYDVLKGPCLTEKAALLQVDRIGRARNLTENQKANLVRIIGEMKEKPQFRLLGKERINVLKLNLALDTFEKNNFNNK